MSDKDKLPDIELICPHCQHRGGIKEFIPPKFGEKFERFAFVLLTVVCTLALLKGCGIL